MNEIRWGIIGCGDVTEVKSGPAFNKVGRSSLMAVMRRDAVKAEDYAKRHSVPKWYTDAQALIDDPDVTAVYVATPPASHKEYTLASLKAGKPVYVEKPMALNEAECRTMAEAAAIQGTKLSVAHYRRALPLYLRIRQLLEDRAIGEVCFVNLEMWQPPQSNKIARSDSNWRVDPALSGGGLFHDLAPHQLDIMLYYFGNVKKAFGLSANQGGLYLADDIVAGDLEFENGVVFKGLWCFTVAPGADRDSCKIVGTEGQIDFSFFGSECVMNRQGKEEVFRFENPVNIQQPMIQKVVNYFLDEGTNPCPPSEAIEVMKVMDVFTNKRL